MIAMRRNTFGAFERFDPQRDGERLPSTVYFQPLPPAMPLSSSSWWDKSERRRRARAGARGRRASRRVRPAMRKTGPMFPPPIVLRGRLYRSGGVEIVLYLCDGDEPTAADLEALARRYL